MIVSLVVIYGFIRIYAGNLDFKLIVPSKLPKHYSFITTTQLPHTNFHRGPGYFKTCKPQSDVVFLKVHKAGSTTVMNILLRYGLYHKLVFVLPKHSNYINRQSELDVGRIIPPPKGKRYNILCNHSVYNRSVFHSLFPPGTFYLAIIRQPFEQFKSAFNYYSMARVVMREKNSSTNPIRDYLQIRNKISIPKFRNFVNNRMAYDFGIAPENFTNYKAIKNYIEILDKDFDLVMILEYFDESLILLRRYLCWTMKDIVSIRLNERKREIETSMDDFERHKNITMADYMIYEHFLGTFWKLVALEGPSFFKELNHYKQIRKIIEAFCKGKSKERKVVIPSSHWNMAFEISKIECEHIVIQELAFINLIRKFQYPI
ncbi:galactosylceramide sulfotransferase-like [Octopus sinensis]|uniref:Galactosylceramide sulfotransferase-like n=1 Tax=Octopus sinensis TaxID=2607531 RepID=A0A6P7TA60_9MOLL|nr:galactosylceramide sulfotransferase-like [Octopus sinensis]